MPIGILIPASQNRFVVNIEATSTEFEQQIVAFAMNLAKKQLLVVVEQSLTAQTREHIVIQDMIDHPTRLITLQIIDAAGDPVDTIKFKDCSVIDHEIEFNYVSNKAALHNIILSYDSADMGNGAGSAYASAMSVVGRP